MMKQLFLAAWLVCGSVTLAQTRPAEILTPPAPATPLLHTPKVFGVRPGHPFLFTLRATGEKPVTFSAEGLPTGLTLDAKTGKVTGTIDGGPAEYRVKLKASNALGATTRDLKIVVGEKIALTPPMGWNTYYAYRLRISDELVRANARAMVSSGLVDHGWEYVNLDEGWGIKGIDGSRDEKGHVQANKSFPDMKGLTDFLHENGLKAGIYSSPGTLCCGGQAGSLGYEDADAEQFAAWGFDYVKYDWCSYSKVADARRLEVYPKLLPDAAEDLRTLLPQRVALEANRTRSAEENAELKVVVAKLDALYAKMNPPAKKSADLEIAQAPYKVFGASLRKAKRDMVYSLCQYGMDNVWEWGGMTGANSWRTTRDIIDSWGRVSSYGFGAQAPLSEFGGPGGWNDPDILQVGTMVKNIPSRLTPDEQYSHMSLWCLLSSPLLIGGDLTKLDPFTLGLLTNDEVIEVNQDPLGKQARRVLQKDGIEVWEKEMEDGSKAVGVFNLGETAREVTGEEVGVKGRARDLWRQKDLGESAKAMLPPHGVWLVRVARK